MLKIYGFQTFNVSKVLITAEEAGLPYEYQHMELADQTHKSDAYVADLHPLGKVPAIDDDGFRLYESAAICRYLAQKAGSGLYPGDLKARALVDQWVDMIVHHPGRWMVQHYFEEVIKRVVGAGGPDADAIAEAKGFLDAQLPVLEQQLDAHAYLAGDQLTIADTIAVAIFSTTDVTSVDISAYPKLTAWYAGMIARPSFTKGMANFPGGKLVQ